MLAWFLGGVIGASIGVFVMALLAAAGQADACERCQGRQK